ncbi:MAG TPA: hypothetical protein VE868_11030, partial [Balneolaceae bacterium]|nr:hypothetical protein [Balneolaceae bacterium]
MHSIPRYASPVSSSGPRPTVPSKVHHTHKTGKSSSPVPIYTCVVSTLMPADSVYNYRYNTYKITIPKTLKDKPVERHIFMYGAGNAPSYAKNIPGQGGVTRMARCRIPKNQSLIKWLRNKFTHFGPGSWVAVHGKAEKTGRANKSTGTFPRPRPAMKIVCDHWQIAEVCDGNGNNCVVKSITCISYHYVSNSPAGTQQVQRPSGGGGSSEDPCQPCTQNATGSRTACRSGSGATPTGCAVSGGGSLPAPPTDPCKYANPPAYCTQNKPC